jgi:cellulose biosynthesis protein BcsQ
MTSIPALEIGTQSKIHLIGGEKGGVGKSLTARLLANLARA